MKSLVLIGSLLLLTGCPSGSPLYKMTTSHNFCGEDQKDMQKMDADKTAEFFKLVAPIADLDRASQQAPNNDDTKIKRPDVQDKIVVNMREKCLFKKTQNKIGEDYKHQTFKFDEKIVTLNPAKANVKCPVEIYEKADPDNTAPALVENAPHAIRSVKSNALAKWEKKDPAFKLLGAISVLELKGAAETLWYKPSKVEDTPVGWQNIILSVDETFDMSLTTDNGVKTAGQYKTCSRLQEDLDPNGTRPPARYSSQIVRLTLNTDKDKREAKFITVIKYVLDKNTNTWITDRSVRNNFYINGLMLSDEEIANLEKKRQESIGFTKP